MKLYKTFWIIMIGIFILILCLERSPYIPHEYEYCSNDSEVIITDEDIDNFKKYLEKK